MDWMKEQWWISGENEKKNPYYQKATTENLIEWGNRAWITCTLKGHIVDKGDWGKQCIT